MRSNVDFLQHVSYGDFVGGLKKTGIAIDDIDGGLLVASDDLAGDHQVLVIAAELCLGGLGGEDGDGKDQGRQEQQIDRNQSRQ